MDIASTVLLFSGMVLVAILIEPITDRIRLPFSAALILLGLGGAQVVHTIGFDTGIRWDNVYDLIYFVLIPILIFEAAFNLDAKLLRKNLFPILFLAIPLMLLSAGIVAVFVYYAIGHPTGFPWIAALLTGALLSATDPVAVVTLFKKMGVGDRLSLLVDGESLFNDATVVVLFGLIVSLAMAGETTIHLGEASLTFTKVFLGGVIFGVLIGFIGQLMLRIVQQPILVSVLSLILVYASYVIAEAMFGLSGVMTVLMVGLMLGHTTRDRMDEEQQGFIAQLWEYKSWLANTLVFLIAGITIQLSMFTDQWLAIVIGIAGALLARAIGIFGLFPIMNRFPGWEPVNVKYQTIIYWGGVRGAIVLALALSLPIDLPYWWTIQSIAYGVVLFTLFVQAPTMGPLIRRLGV